MKTHTYLIVDDDPAIRGFVERSLRLAGVTQMFFAKSGEEGLALAEQERPDLIILDVRLPAANGLSVLRRLKEAPSTRDIPVLIATGEVDFRLVCDDRHAGAVLSKPFTHRQLLEQIACLLRLEDTSRQLEPAASAA